MKTVLSIIAVLLSVFAVSPSSPVHAASPGCAAVGFSIVNGTTVSPPSAMHFNAGEKIVYTVTSTAIQVANMYIGAMNGGAFANLNPGGLTGTIIYTIPTSGNYQFFFNWSLISAGVTTITATVSCGSGQLNGSGSVPLFTDGRSNKDAAQTAAVYCEQGGVTIYAVVESVGHLAFKVTKAELAAVPAKPDHNTLIKSGSGVSLYRLTTGELQINAPNNYVFTWNGCPTP